MALWPQVLFDDEGMAGIEEILHGIVSTEFKDGGLRHVLAGPERIEGWRVGEAIAETWLIDHRDCHFPWPGWRDERKRRSSLPGADLVGLCADSQGERMAFGEVKTSSEARCPPRVMNGPTGLTQQLADLRDSTSIRDDLFKYLGLRANGAAWMGRFQQAGERYLSSKSDVRLFGFLVRDVSPHENDLNVGVERLSQGCPDDTRIELLALYLPLGHLDGIGKVVVAARAEELP